VGHNSIVLEWHVGNVPHAWHVGNVPHDVFGDDYHGLRSCEVRLMPPIVLLHPFPFDAEYFAPQIAGLPELTVMTPNLLGFGGREGPRPVTVFDQADRIAQDLDDRGIAKAVIGGVSMGGYVSFAFWHRYPERVAALILADTRAEGDDETAKANRAKAIDTVERDGVPAFVESMLPRLLGPSTHANRPDVVAAVRAIGARQSAAGVVAALEMLRERPDWTAKLPSISVPSLIVVGEEDVVTPPALSQAMHVAIPGSTLATIPNAGHLANVESPEAFNDALRAFVKSLTVGS
jgi:pimeloyl-ACP methyl ester carboxylesterase